MALHEGLFEGGVFLGYSLVLSRFFAWLIYLVGGNRCVKYGVRQDLGRCGRNVSSGSKMGDTCWDGSSAGSAFQDSFFLR